MSNINHFSIEKSCFCHLKKNRVIYSVKIFLLRTNSARTFSRVAHTSTCQFARLARQRGGSPARNWSIELRDVLWHRRRQPAANESTSRGVHERHSSAETRRQHHRSWYIQVHGEEYAGPFGFPDGPHRSKRYSFRPFYFPWPSFLPVSLSP